MLPDDPEQVEFLKDRLLSASPDDLPIIRDALYPQKSQLIEGFWQVLKNLTGKQKEQTLQAASALARYDPDSPQWVNVAAKVANDLVSVSPVFLTQWMQALRPARQHLIDALATAYRNSDGQHTEIQRSLATSVFEDYAADRPDVLADLLMDAESKQFRALYPKFGGSSRKGPSGCSRQRLTGRPRTNGMTRPLIPCGQHPIFRRSSRSSRQTVCWKNDLLFAKRCH